MADSGLWYVPNYILIVLIDFNSTIPELIINQKGWLAATAQVYKKSLGHWAWFPSAGRLASISYRNWPLGFHQHEYQALPKSNMAMGNQHLVRWFSHGTSIHRMVGFPCSCYQRVNACKHFIQQTWSCQDMVDVCSIYWGPHIWTNCNSWELTSTLACAFSPCVVGGSWDTLVVARYLS